MSCMETQFGQAFKIRSGRGKGYKCEVVKSFDYLGVCQANKNAKRPVKVSKIVGALAELFSQKLY